MPQPLPRLRLNLDFMPSPSEDRPGLVIRDPFRYSEATLIVPPPLVAGLQFFDGEQTELDLRKYLVEVTGDLDVSELEQHLVESLSHTGFLEDENFARQPLRPLPQLQTLLPLGRLILVRSLHSAPGS
ncbi:MAG: hypothetical protein ABI165_13705 [Bryobacteraceae bacterium]